MESNKKKILVNIIIFGLTISFFSITYAGFNFIKTYVIENGYLYQEKYGKTVQEFKEDLNNPDLQIYNQNGEILQDTDKISTGDTYIESEKENVIVLRGDLNGDGNMDEKDFLAIKEHMVEKNILENEYKEASDLDENGEVNLTDVLLFKRVKQAENPEEPEKQVENIEVINLPNKTNYVQNSEELDVTGGKIKITYNDGTTEDLNMTEEMVSGFDNSELGPKTITVTYEGKTDTFEVTIIEKVVESIEISVLPNKTNYVQNSEELDVTGGKIRVTYNDGTTEEKDMEINMVRGFSNSELGPETITVTYEGKTATFEITIIEKAVTNIEIINLPNKTNYVQNSEELDVMGGKIRITYNDMTTEEKDMEISMVSGFDNSELGPKTITVTYGGKTATYEVTIIEKVVESIEISVLPDKTKYIQNSEELDVTGGKIRVIYNDKTTEDLNITEEMVSGFDNSELGKKTITVTYEEKTTTFEIEIVEKLVTNIEVINLPNKTNYVQNSEELDVTGGKIKITYNDGTTEEKDMEISMVSGFDNSELGPKTITVTYEEKTTTFEIEIVEKLVTNIEVINLPNKTNYVQNSEELDVTGGKIRVTYNDGTTEEKDIEISMVSGFDNSVLGPKTITVTYEGKTATFEVTIIEKVVESIEISVLPDKTKYIQNSEELDVTGGKIRITYNDMTTEEKDMEISMVSGFDNSELGPKTITVTYGGKTATYEVTIIEKVVESIEISVLPDKTKYIQNSEELDVTGGKIRIIYNDKTTEDLNMTEEMVSGFDNSELGPKTVTVTYEGKTATFEVTIIEKVVTNIEIINLPNKTNYVQNSEELDVTGGKIRITYNDMTTEEKDMELNMVSGFDNSELGPKTITVTYEGKTATFEVTIIEAEKTAKLDKTEIELNAEEETTLRIITTPDNVEKSYKMQVDNSSVINVEKTDEFGVLKITGLAKGTAKITFIVTVDGTEFTLECRVTVNAPDILVTEIKLDKTEITIEKGQTETITATILPENATNKRFTWSTDNKDIVGLRLAEQGTLTIEGLSAGTATITATTEDGNKQAICKVTVTDSEATGISLNKTKETIANKEELEIIANVSGENQNVTWETSNSVIAKISKTENNKITVTGEKAGTATITAKTEDGKTATCEITVVYPVAGITINEESESITVGSKTLLSSVLEPINATNQKITWSSSNGEIATVDEYGIVEGLKAGNVTITATAEDGNKQATCEITVTNKKAETSASEFTYTTQYGVTSITGYTGSDTEVVIPETINGRTVEEIGNGYSQVTGFDNVTSIVLPDTVKIINRQSFKGYSNLTKIDLKNVEQIDVSAFAESGLTKVTLPETLKIIGDYAFNKCTNLEGNIIIPNSVTTMGKYCFAECTKISTVKFSENCDKIPERAFYKSSLTGPLVFPEGVVTIDAYSFYGTKCTSVKFADSIKYIYQNAFRQCSSKMEGELILPKNLEHWGDALFDHARNCTNTTIVIPKTVKYIGGDGSPTTYPDTYRKENTGYGTHTFYDIATYSLKEFVVEEGNENYQVVDGVLFSKDMKRLVAFPSAKTVENGLYEIPEGVERIDELSFSLAGYAGFPGNLKTLKLPSTFKISEYGPDNIMCKEPSKSQVCYNTLSVGLYIYNGINEIIVSEDNPDFKSVDGCVYSKDGSTLWYVPIQKTGTLNIPEGTTKIARGAFAEGYSTCPLAITGLNIPASLVEIEEDTLPWINKLPSRCTITVDENNPYWTVDSNGDIVEK